MTFPLTERDREGTVRLKSWALPIVVAAICVPVIGAMLLGMVTIEGTGLGLAAGALAVAALLVSAARAKSGDSMEVAPGPSSGARLLVIALAEPTPDVATRIHAHAPDASDVRLLVPLRSRRIDRWLSAEDQARDEAERLLARSAGSLVAAGLPVSGSLGDSDPVQALEDELRGFAADEVIVLEKEGKPDPLAGAEDRLELPLSRIAV